MGQDSRICREVFEVSRRVSRWLFWQPGVGEESLTDWLLYEIADRLPFVHYLKFTRRQEARDSGADWEWWFVGRKLSLGLRIQAKKLYRETDNYPSLAYTNSYGLQIERLIESANSANLLPFFVLYHCTSAPPPIRCKDYKNAGLWEGVFLASATELHDRFIVGRRVKVDSTDLLEMSDALSGLFCPRNIKNKVKDPIEGIHGYLAEYFAGLQQTENWNGRQGLHGEVPQYVAGLFTLDHQEVSSWEREYANQIEDIKALFVFDMREC
jgi:hypothetical protein